MHRLLYSHRTARILVPFRVSPHVDRVWAPRVATRYSHAASTDPPQGARHPLGQAAGTLPTSATKLHNVSEDAPLAERQMAKILHNDIFDGPKKATKRAQEQIKAFPQHFELTDDTMTADTARETMLAFNSKLRTMPASAAVAEVRHESIGRQVLTHLLGTPQKERERIGYDFRFLALLAHFVVAEQQEQLFWQAFEEELKETRSQALAHNRMLGPDQLS
ncbi:hypothetical protein LTR85_002809 [Meristemomyces frigidus]|nr:hypothetical protein LTR85_002809 [Meristemomyces frigidus]